MQMVQNALIVWLDSKINENKVECRNSIMQLRQVIDNVNTFTDGELAIQFLEDMNDEKAFMIISGSLGQHIVSRIHSMSQVDYIFIFCGNKNYHEQWAKQWSTIKGVFTDISDICKALKQTATKPYEQNVIPISVTNTGHGAKKNLNQLDLSFMYVQIIKEILLVIDYKEKDFKQYIEYCREVFAENDIELKNIEKFEQQYRNETPIWWYTSNSFLYRMLNRALQVMDIDIIIKMGFFIKDLHRHIEQLHQEQLSSAHSKKKLIVYRGQGIPKEDFEKINENRGGLIPFNSFLSTIKDRSRALNFAHHTLTNPDSVGVLFIMNIDPSQSPVPFACTKNVSYYKDDDEVLFAMQTVFRIDNILSIDENSRLFQIEVTLTSDNDADLRVLTDSIREETYPNEEGWYRLGSVLFQIGQFDKAEEIYQVLLENIADEGRQALIYNQLGLIKNSQKQYPEAITYYEKSLVIQQKHLPPNHPDLAKIYNNTAEVYNGIGEFSKALSYYEKSLEIRQRTLPPNHPNLAASYHNLGLVSEKMGDYSKACSFYQHALNIGQQTLPPNHLNIQKYNQQLADIRKKL